MQEIKIEEIIPAWGQVIIKPDEQEESVAGIIQPNGGEEKSQFGTVIAAGPALPDQKVPGETGELKPGQRVIYRKWGGNDVVIGEQKYYFLKYEEIIGVVK